MFRMMQIRGSARALSAMNTRSRELLLQKRISETTPPLRYVLSLSKPSTGKTTRGRPNYETKFVELKVRRTKNRSPMRSLLR